jgi:hypothetical protein
MSTDDALRARCCSTYRIATVKAGEVFTVTFKGAEKVQGYQFTLNSQVWK